MQLQALWTAMPSSRERSRLEGIIADAGRCSAEARRSLWGLRTGERHPEQFSAKLARTMRDSVARSDLRLILQLDPVPVSLSPETEYQILRIAGEAATNVLKHARATTMKAKLEVAGGQLSLMISDDGRGFSPAFDKDGHFGLAAMRERAAEIQAQLVINTAGSGTVISLHMPLSCSAAVFAQPSPTSIHYTEDAGDRSSDEHSRTVSG
jgi:signal transduction histidine kinase